MHAANRMGNLHILPYYNLPLRGSLLSYRAPLQGIGRANLKPAHQWFLSAWCTQRSSLQLQVSQRPMGTSVDYSYSDTVPGIGLFLNEKALLYYAENLRISPLSIVLNAVLC